MGWERDRETHPHKEIQNANSYSSSRVPVRPATPGATMGRDGTGRDRREEWQLAECCLGNDVVEHRKLQALVYDILPSTTAVFSYVIGS